jgi:hypothetical protein
MQNLTFFGRLRALWARVQVLFSARPLGAAFHLCELHICGMPVCILLRNARVPLFSFWDRRAGMSYGAYWFARRTGGDPFNLPMCGLFVVIGMLPKKAVRYACRF